MSRAIDIERMRELLEHRDGKLYWRMRRKGARVGQEAGTLRKDGYRRVMIDGRLYPSHRIIYAIVHNIDPADKHVDHIDGNRLNNRIENLRMASHAENLRHRIGLDAKNTSGFRGVCWYKQTGKWQVHIRVNGRRIGGGYFADIADANAKAIALRLEHFGEFQGVAV